ncbi:MAG: hypothetical protein JNK11_19280, partial [Alphaproteobacteria bacterium]|nr:hypothetical protein [Alphaproteobacteria bacterium]
MPTARPAAPAQGPAQSKALAPILPPRLDAIVGPGPVSFQGAPGAYSNLACRESFPQRATLPCHTFEDAFAAVQESRAAMGMIPVDNSIAGRVADIHHLLPGSGLHIVAEHFQPVNHQL